MPSTITLVITKSSLNTCPPYTIRYPRPAFETRNSPEITPTKERPIFTLRAFINVEIFDGNTIFEKICHLFALNVFAIFIRFLSVLEKPFNISKMVTPREIASAIVIIAGVPAPTHTIIIGPNATFGRLFRITKYGSATFEMKSDHHKMLASRVPINVP